ncbi:MAG: hypothetical protein AB7N91_33025, partial [Candidatus Tectimicrobiota bacterium]
RAQFQQHKAIEAERQRVHDREVQRLMEVRALAAQERERQRQAEATKQAEQERSKTKGIDRSGPSF